MAVDDLLAREMAAWAALRAAMDAVPADRRSEEGVVPGWSAHDLVWHCGFWAGFVGGELEKIAAGLPTDPDHDDAYWDAVNAEVFEEARTLSWDESWARSEAERERARAALTALGTPTEEAADEFASETFRHYEEHAAEVDVFLHGT